MLSVKAGNYHPSLENAFIDTIQTLKRDDPLTPIAVVAPSNWMIKRLQERLVQEHGAAYLNISFMNFFVLAREICSRSGIEAGHIIQQPVIYEHIIAGLLKQDVFRNALFKNVQSLPALARALFQVVQDFSDADICIDDLKEILREGFIEDTDMQKLSGVIQLYDIFKQKLKALNISHYSDVYHKATPCVANSEYLRGFKHILAYGFYDLTGVEQDFFREIFRSHSTIFFLPYIKNHPSFSYVKPFFESFVLGLAHEREEMSSDKEGGFSYILSPKRHEEQEISDSLQTKNTNIHVFNVSGKRDEVWTVAKEIQKLLDAGYAFSEIGVVARVLEPYTDDIKKIFQENFIPFVTSAQESMGRYPLVKIIQQILLLKRENYYRPMVIELLKSPYFNISSGNVQKLTPRPDLWDILSRKLGIRGDITCWLSRLKQYRVASFDDFSGEEAETNNRIPIEQVEFLENVLCSLSQDISSLPEKGSWAMVSEKITQFLQKHIRIPSENMDTEDRDRDRTIMGKLWELLRTLHTLDCLEEEVTLDQCIDTFIEACQQEGMLMGLENKRGVKVFDAMSARGIPFRVLFVLGLNEKIFPRAISEEPFLRDHVRRKLTEVLGNVIPEKLRGYEEELLLFSFLLNAAQERLYLLYERSDEAGKPKVPSHYLMDIFQSLKATSPQEKHNREKSAYEEYIPRGIKDKLGNRELSLLTPGEIGTYLALERIDATNFLKAFKKSGRIFEHAQSALNSQEGYYSQLTPYDGIVGDISQWWEEWIRHGVSPTALSSYGVCPFKFFMERALGLESLEEPEMVDEIPSVDIGNLYHNILREFYCTLIEKKYFSTKPAQANLLDTLRTIAQKHFAGIEKQVPIPYPIIWEIKKEEMLTFLCQFVIRDIERIEQSGYIPAYLEKTARHNLNYELPDKKIREVMIKGKIDRIDIKTTGSTVHFQVIDYKSGRYLKENLIKSAIRGQKFQLPFYIIMAEHLLTGEIRNGRISQSQAQLHEASLVYIAQNTSDDAIPEETITEDAWKDHGGQCCETLQEFLHSIHNGLFPAMPGDDTQKCEWCEFSTICRRSFPPMRFRLEHDIRLNTYREIIKRDVIKKSKKNE